MNVEGLTWCFSYQSEEEYSDEIKVLVLLKSNMFRQKSPIFPPSHKWFFSFQLKKKGGGGGRNVILAYFVTIFLLPNDFSTEQDIKHYRNHVLLSITDMAITQQLKYSFNP